VFHQSTTVFRQRVVYVPARKLLVKHIIDNPAVVPTGRIMFSLAASGGLAHKGGIAGKGGGLAG